MLCALIALSVVADGRVAELEARVKKQPNAANYRALADAYLDANQYQKASGAFMEASQRYGKLGDANAAKVLSDLSKRYGTVVRFFTEVPAPPDPNAILGKFEPPTGCYLGANIEREDSTRNPQAFNNLIGKHHAIYFTYRRYGVAFPKAYAENLRHGKCGLQLAFEPRDILEVQDDGYLHKFAEDARDSGIPIFLRFASEMNGDWVSYGRDPELYKQKFQLVARVVRSIAPNVAMVWCPNEIPEAPIPSYYPGPEAVDWVGVNFYSVIYNDADRARAAEWRVPTDALDFVYRTYSGQHPIMVGEWAASHRSSIDDHDRPDFAIAKISQFYSAIPLLYPRVKAVSWLSMNTLKYASPGRQLNNYSLFDDRLVAAAYTGAVSNDYYLDRMDEAPESPTKWVPVAPGTSLAPGAKVAVYARCYDPAVKVVVSFGKEKVFTSQVPGAATFTLPESIAVGKAKLEGAAIDTAGRVALRTDVTVEVK